MILLVIFLYLILLVMLFLSETLLAFIFLGYLGLLTTLVYIAETSKSKFSIICCIGMSYLAAFVVLWQVYVILLGD